MLRGLAETQGAGLTIEQREQFYSLLLTYADIFASSNSDLGRTDKLSHSIPPMLYMTLLLSTMSLFHSTTDRRDSTTFYHASC